MVRWEIEAIHFYIFLAFCCSNQNITDILSWLHLIIHLYGLILIHYICCLLKIPLNKLKKKPYNVQLNFFDLTSALGSIAPSGVGSSTVCLHRAWRTVTAQRKAAGVKPAQFDGHPLAVCFWLIWLINVVKSSWRCCSRTNIKDKIINFLS